MTLPPLFFAEPSRLKQRDARFFPISALAAGASMYKDRASLAPSQRFCAPSRLPQPQPPPPTIDASTKAQLLHCALTNTALRDNLCAVRAFTLSRRSRCRFRDRH
jgi:hypothetical protein